MCLGIVLYTVILYFLHMLVPPLYMCAFCHSLRMVGAPEVYGKDVWPLGYFLIYLGVGLQASP